MVLSDIFIFTLVLFTLQCLICHSKKCSTTQVHGCKFNNANQKNMCDFNDKIISCLNSLEDCDARAQRKATQLLKMTQDSKKECSGLPDGDCFVSEMVSCVKDVSVYLYGSINDIDCKGIERIGDKAEQCMNTLKTKCDAIYPTQQIEERLRDLEKGRQQCGLSKN